MDTTNRSDLSSRPFDDNEMMTFLEYFINGVQTFQDELHGAWNQDDRQATHCLNMLFELKTDQDFREILMEYAEGRKLIPEIESTKRGVKELISYHTMAFSEIMSSLESCTANIFSPDNPERIVHLGEVLRSPDIMKNSTFLSFLNPVIEHMTSVSGSDRAYANHCYDVTKMLYAGTTNPKETGCEPTSYKPRYLIAMRYLDCLPKYMDYTLLLVDQLTPIFETAIKRRFPQAKIQTYIENANKLRVRIKKLFTDYKQKRFNETIQLITDEFNQQIKEIYSKLMDVPQCKEDAIRKYMKSGKEEDLEDDLLENHCQILRNLNHGLVREPGFAQITASLDFFLKGFIVSIFTYKMIDDDVD